MKGLIVPVLTPFKESGELDQKAFVRHLEFLAEGGVQRLMVNGTTGEFYSLLPEERKAVMKLARSHFSGQIILHAGGCGLEQNLNEIRWAERCGADGVAVLPPFYPAGLDSAGIIGYLNALEAAVRVPFILYNFPKHTGNALTPEILEAVPHYALKDSSANFELIEYTPKYFVGSSSRIFEPISQGAAGFVSATANVRPELYSAFENLLASARVEEAAQMQKEVSSYSRAFSSGGVPLLKQALSRVLPGYPVHVRLPLCPVSGSEDMP